MRTAVALVLLLTGSSVLAGCIGTDDGSEDVDEAGLPLVGGLPAVVHLPGGLLPEGALAIPTVSGAFLGLGGHSAIEPTLGINSAGTIFYAAAGFGLAPNGGPATDVMRSRDGGVTWEIVTPTDPVTNERAPPSTGDPYVYVDPWTDIVYNFDMNPGLVCAYLSWSADEGDSWDQRPLACGTTPPYDHQTLSSVPSPAGAVHDTVLVQCINRIIDSICARSFTGGYDWVTGAPAFLGYDATRAEVNTSDPPIGPLVGVLSGLCGGLHGHLAGASDGTLYLPRTYCGDPLLAISHDYATTWTQVQVNDLGSMADPAVTVDPDGNVYFLQLTPEGRLFLTVSTDQGATWGEPMDVTAPGVDAARFPTITAGDAGKIAFAYLGTENLPGGYEHEEFQDGYDPDEDDAINNATWNGYVAILENALEAEPIIQTAAINAPDEPLLRGHCGPFRCPGMYDFIDIEISPVDGRPYAAFVDACRDVCDTPEGTHEDTLPIADPDYEGGVGTLIAGPRLVGEGALPLLGATSS